MIKYNIGDIVVGKVTSVKPYALFVGFDDGSKGLVHISELSDLYVRDIEKFATIDDEIKVKVIDIDQNNGFLKLSYKRVPESEKYCSHVSTRKTAPLVSNEEDFATLKSKMDEWIKETLIKAKEDK